MRMVPPGGRSERRGSAVQRSVELFALSRAVDVVSDARQSCAPDLALSTSLLYTSAETLRTGHRDLRPRDEPAFLCAAFRFLGPKLEATDRARTQGLSTGPESLAKLPFKHAIFSLPLRGNCVDR